MQIKIGVSRKSGRPGYGSEGASVEVTLDVSETSVSENPDSLVTEIRRAQALCDQAVAEQLAKSEPPPRIEPERPDYGTQPSQTQPPSYPEPERREQPQYPPRRQPERREPPPADPRDQYDGRGPRNDGHDNPPRYGRQLFPWAKKLEERGLPGFFAALEAMGEERGYPRKFSDWNHSETADAVALWRQMSGQTAPAAGRNGNGSY